MHSQLPHQIIRIASKFSNHDGLLNPDNPKAQEIKIADLGIDSLSKLEMVMEIEEALSCDLPEVGLAACESLKDLTALCEQCLQVQRT